MKTLFLLRHASAENASCRVNDLNRRLSAAGRQEARAVSGFIRNRKLDFDLIICSTATRARETMSLALPETVNASFDQRVYETTATQILDLLNALEPAVNTILLVGHNPSLEQLVALMTGAQVRMAPATLVKIDLLAGKWSTLNAGGAKLDWLVEPADIN